ncbi:tetratricopeptide repeat protein [Periweissella cryptocerci]|uniref:Tetratricopeptide repeat protein n=1 Tax=Periweissella cryptocerci TaxID=2506420 RepID=A0A4P6YR95_9LACO|nr:tetratricopeptide repeat protein [Periweissella cryptocerci]QBO35112.1 tetratricopeptide repeat protein [Periweissella cryptocerci]
METPTDQIQPILNTAIQLTQAGKYEEVITALTPAIKLYNDGFYNDDADSEYHYLDAGFEQILFQNFYQPTKTVRFMPIDFSAIFTTIGQAYMVLGQFTEAKDAFATALKINPFQFIAIFGIANIDKLEGHNEHARKTLNDGLILAYMPAQIAQTYHEMAKLYLDQGVVGMGIALLELSLRFQDDEKIMHELDQLQAVNPDVSLGDESTEWWQMVEDAGIQVGPSTDVIAIAMGVAKSAVQNQELALALEVLQLVYDLTSDERVLESINTIKVNLEA